MRCFSLVSLLFMGSLLWSQPASKRISQAEYIEMYKDDAIREMKRSGVPASITLAQGILESGNGNSPLARYANNHFGIKCHSDWNGPTFIQDDDERDECFRKYKHALESFKDHSDFLRKPRYADLFELKITDYKAWAKGLKKAGYATNPKYPKLLIDIIERNDLSQYDRGYRKEGKQKRHEEVPEKVQLADRSSANNASSRHRVLVHENNIKYIQSREGDDFEELADEFNMGLWQFYKYNDLDKGDPVPEGIIYLQPKRNRAQTDYHIVQSGESMWDISQKYGIKLKKLYRKNRMDRGEQAEVGEKLYLRKKRPR